MRYFLTVDSQAISSSHHLTVAQRIERWDGMLTALDLAPLLSTSPKTLYKRVAAGTMPAHRILGSVRFDPVETAKWLRSKAA